MFIIKAFMHFWTQAIDTLHPYEVKKQGIQLDALIYSLLFVSDRAEKPIKGQIQA